LRITLEGPTIHPTNPFTTALTNDRFGETASLV
jgi:hypothetical protein